MVRQAVRETFTYYTPDAPEGHVVENSPLAGRGKAWVAGSYRHPVYPSPLTVRVGEAGIKVWMVIDLLNACGGDEAQLLERYGETFHQEDIEVARWYYQENKDLIDRELREEAWA